MHYARALSATLAAGAAAAVLAGCAGTDTSPSGKSAPPKPSAATSATAPHNAADVAFAQGMIPHHRQAIEMSRLAAERARSEEVKKLADQIEGAQAPEIRTLTGWLRQWGVPVSAENMPNMNQGDGGHGGTGRGGMGMMSADEMQQLAEASGAEFDRMFLTMMIKHHQGAVTMARTELRSGQYPPARQLAQKIIDAQQAEIATMKNLLARR